MWMKFGLALLVGLTLAVACTKGEQLPGPSTTSTSPTERSEWHIPSTDSFVIHSAVAQHDFQITVAVPRGYKESSIKYPVLYVLDANFAFPVAVEMARVLAIGPKENPTGDLKEEPVIVGVGYPVGLYWNAIAPRLKDFTPSPNPKLVADVAKAIGFAPETSGSGGAAAFREFLAKEMMPAVEGRYRVDERRRALFGHSFSRAFHGAYSLFITRTFQQLSYNVSGPGFGQRRYVETRAGICPRAQRPLRSSLFDLWGDGRALQWNGSKTGSGISIAKI
jgi:putative esterase